jgi:hypothetical protein
LYSEYKNRPLLLGECSSGALDAGAEPKNRPGALSQFSSS